jgi:acyl-CoA synthetase (AMP-forming)/AMP-acid ligase II
VLNVGHATDAALAVVPDRAALVVDGVTHTYRGLERLIRQVTAALAAAGVGPGDRVALVNLGSALSVATILGAARLGAATAQMNAYLTIGELATLVELVGARVGVAGDPFADSLRSVVDGPVLGEREVDRADPDAAAGSPTVGEGDDTALVLFTSGTTGLPKPIAISHRAVADRLAFYSKPIDPDAAQVVDMMSAPIFHIAGTLGLFVSLHQGKQLVLLPRFDADAWLSLVERHRVDPDLRGAHDAPPDPRPPPVRHHRPQLVCGRSAMAPRRLRWTSSDGRWPPSPAWTSPTPSARPRRWAPTRP